MDAVQLSLAYSGTFFDSNYFPTIGYDNSIELDDPRRREDHLTEQELLPHRGDPIGTVNNNERDFSPFSSANIASWSFHAIGAATLSKEEQIIQANQTFAILVDQMPSRAGIDPYNKLIDRIPDDNIIVIVKQ